MEESMKLSKFCKVIKVEENVYAVFNTLFMKIIFVDKDYKDKIENYEISKSDSDLLVRNGIYNKRRWR